jgi:hypothetical protein
MIHNHLRRITHPVVVNHGVLWWASGCESWWAMLSHLLWIMVCYAEPVGVNHSHWHSINTMIHNHWLSIAHYDSQPQAQNNTPWFTTTGKYHNSLRFTTIGCYDEPVVVNRGELCWAICCESWCAMLSQWVWIMMCYTEPVVVDHVVLFWESTHHHSQQQAQYSSPWFTTTGSA